MPEELRPRLTGEFRFAKERECNLDISSSSPKAAIATHDHAGHPTLILSPPPEPKKTDREVLDMLVSAYFHGQSALEQRAEEARQHLAQTEAER